MKFLTAAAASCVLLGSSSIVFAVDLDPYIGATIGQERNNFCSRVTDPPSGVSMTCDDDLPVYSVFAGLKLGKWFALEAAYVDTGLSEADFFIEDDPDLSASVDSDIDGAQVMLIANAPINEKAELFVRIGAFFWDFKSSGSIVGEPIEPLAGDGTDMMFGVGFNWNAFRRVGFRFSFDRYQTPDALNTFNAGAYFRF